MLQATSVMLVGDTHADTHWMRHHVYPMAVRENVPVVLVVGDFGYWRSALDFRRLCATSFSQFGVVTWFLDGNHEDHPYLLEESEACREGGLGDREPVALGESLWYLPRGSRVSVGGLRVGILGGAVSIDRLWRMAGEDWFLEEQISDSDLAALACDVLLTHDTPDGYQIPGLARDSELPEEWRKQLPACHVHRGIVREGFASVTPRLLVHGHYHVPYELSLKEEWGSVRVVGLDCNQSRRFARILTCEDGEPVLSDWVSDIDRSVVSDGPSSSFVAARGELG
jgi:hypothetical protein